MPRKRKIDTTSPVPAHEWAPRNYQRAALDAFDSGTKRLLLVWHRRAGKDRFGLELIRSEADKRVGSYWHLYPLHVQAERAIWNGVDPETKTRLLDLVFPPVMRVDEQPSKMFMRFRNGSTYQLLGSDKYDRLVGSNVLGVLFSEWALCDPHAWPYIMPILVENGGWAAFITTYRGRNHAYQMAKMLAKNPDWYVDVRAIDTTQRADGTPVVAPRDVQSERDSLLAIHKSPARVDAILQEEFYCNPMASSPGSIYGGAVAKMLAEGRA